MPNEVSRVFDEIVREAEGLCADGTVHNLFLRREFPIEVIDDPFGGLHEEKAAAWQQPTRPGFLHLNHGEYIHRSGDGTGYIIEELTRKGDSNRALFSLIDMEDVIRSGDNPIPSFMVLQFSRSGSTLHCTAYFRALEVWNFLPINLTEMCQVMRQIRDAFPDLVRVALCVHAFRAYMNREFDCLEISAIDRMKQGEVALLVYTGQKDRLRELLEHKMRESSVVRTEGLTEVLTGAQNDGAVPYGADFVRNVEQALERLRAVAQLRTRASHAEEISRVTGEFRTYLERAIAEIR